MKHNEYLQVKIGTYNSNLLVIESIQNQARLFFKIISLYRFNWKAKLMLLKIKSISVVLFFCTTALLVFDFFFFFLGEFMN